jgi:hypothetical protein
MLAVLDDATRRGLSDFAEVAHTRRWVDIVPFEPWHLDWLGETTARAWLGKSIEYGEALQRGGPAYSAFVEDAVIACAGVVLQWEGRAVAWSLLSLSMPTALTAVFKHTKRFLNQYAARRVECTVDPRSAQAKNWATHLGFRYEGLMRAYTPQGDDMELWARVKHG